MEFDTNINTNENLENEVNDDTSDVVEEFEATEADEVDAAETDDRPRGRGRGRGHRGPGGRRPFGPNRPYRFALFVDENGGYVLRSPDLADHTTKVESLDAVGAAMQAAIDERTAEDAAAQAEAEKDAQFSGKFVLRLPRSMHRQLTHLAEAEGVSLNQLALGFLAEGMGRAEMIQEFQDRRGKHRGPRGGRGPEGRGGRGPEGRGGRGPEGFGPRGGRGPEGRSSEGRDFEGRRHEGRGPWGRGPWGHAPHDRDAEGRGPKGHGRGPRWFERFEREVSNAEPMQESPEPNGQSFV